MTHCSEIRSPAVVGVGWLPIVHQQFKHQLLYPNLPLFAVEILHHLILVNLAIRQDSIIDGRGEVALNVTSPEKATIALRLHLLKR